MEGNSVLLIIVGIVIIFISYVVSEKIIDRNTSGQNDISFDQSTIDNIWKEKEEELCKNLDMKIQERADETINYVDDKLAHVSNEKIMALSEYSDQILEQIDKNHKEVVFLYDMLNEKESEMKDFVQEIDKSKVVLEEIANKELEKRKMVQHKRIQKELEEQLRKQEELERQKDDLMMSGYISNNTIEKNYKDQAEKIKLLAEEETKKEEMSALERMGVEVEEAPSKKETREIKEIKQVELPIGEENNNHVILELYNEGKTIMEIAKLLGKGQGEVKLVIDLFQGNNN
ncbi:MAG: hypothetical protein HFJ09_08115 [Lachnospiraceae bacterium]|nr:hypothetical protein [Lachnospiraceae bacterium]